MTICCPNLWHDTFLTQSHTVPFPFHASALLRNRHVVPSNRIVNPYCLYDLRFNYPHTHIWKKYRCYWLRLKPSPVVIWRVRKHNRTEVIVKCVVYSSSILGKPPVHLTRTVSLSPKYLRPNRLIGGTFEFNGPTTEGPLEGVTLREGQGNWTSSRSGKGTRNRAWLAGWLAGWSRQPHYPDHSPATCL